MGKRFETYSMCCKCSAKNTKEGQAAFGQYVCVLVGIPILGVKKRIPFKGPKPSRS